MRFRTVILSLLSLPLIGGQAAALERMQLFRDDLFFLHVDNTAETRAALDRLFINRLRSDERFQEFASAIDAKFSRKDPEAKVGGTLRFLQIFGPVLKGELVAAQNVADDESGAYLAAAMSEENFEKSLAKGEWVFEHTQYPAETVKSRFQDHQLIKVITDKGTNGTSACWITHADGTMLVSSDREWVEQSLVALQKDPVVEPEGESVTGRFPIHVWIDNSLRKMPDGKRQNMRILLSALGILGIEQYRFKLLLNEEGLVWDGNLDMDSLGSGIFNLLDTTIIPSPDSRLFSTETSSFSCTHLDLAGFWRKLPEMTANLPDNAGRQLNLLEPSVLQLTGISLDQDVFQHAGELLTTWTETIGTNQHLAVSLSLKDGAALQNTLDRFLGGPMGAAIAPGIKTETFRDRTLYSYGKNGQPEPMVNLCITDDLLVVSGQKPDPIHNLIQRLDVGTPGNTSPLPESARTFAPRAAYAFGAADHREACGIVSARMSDSSFSVNAGISSTPKSKEAGSNDLGENEISLDYVTAFLGDSYNYAEATDQGIHHQIMFKYNETKGVN